jgi:hypothetical protein
VISASLRDSPSPASTPSRSTRIRRSPSAPNIQQVSATPPRRVASPSLWLRDDRLHNLKARDWDITYIDDVGFRNIIGSYLVWDHPAVRPFDENDFLDGLVGLPSDTCSVMLVHVVLAYGSVSLLLEWRPLFCWLISNLDKLLAHRSRGCCCCP